MKRKKRLLFQPDIKEVPKTVHKEKVNTLKNQAKPKGQLLHVVAPKVQMKKLQTILTGHHHHMNDNTLRSRSTLIVN
jgi:hypothetical protein